MGDHISKSALIEQLTEWANRNEMKGLLIECNVVRACIGVVESQPTLDEKEIIRKPMERIIERLKVLHDLVKMNQKLAVSQSIDIVKEEGGIE